MRGTVGFGTTGYIHDPSLAYDPVGHVELHIPVVVRLNPNPHCGTWFHLLVVPLKGSISVNCACGGLTPKQFAAAGVLLHVFTPFEPPHEAGTVPVLEIGYMEFAPSDVQAHEHQSAPAID